MLISLDLETTGFNPGTDQIIEFGAIKFDPFDPNAKRETLQFLCNPGYTLPQIITHITNITDADLRNMPPFEENIEEVRKFIGNDPIIGHNIQFDLAFLSSNGIPTSNLFYDTQQLASILLPGLPSYSLEILSSILDLQHAEKHRALDDSIAAMELFNELIEEFKSLPKDQFEKIKSASQKSNWPFKNFLQNLEANGNQKIRQTPPAARKKSDYEDILKAQSPTLIQKIPPFYDLAADVCENSTNALIAAPNFLFHDLPGDLPKLDLPENYISAERLSEFENQNFFEEHELTALLKYIIWLPQSKTGHLSEVRLSNEERSTIAKVQIINSQEHPRKSNFPAEQSFICTYKYLIENSTPENNNAASTESPISKKIFLFDLENFHKTLHHHLSIYLNSSQILSIFQHLQQLHPDNQTLTSLIAKTTIFFGLVGIVYEKFNDHDEYAPRSGITPATLLSKEWHDARLAAQHLIEISAELVDIVSPQTKPYLEQLKKVLKTLEQIFKTPDLEKNMLWIEQNFHEEMVIRKVPYSIADELNQILKNYVIIDECTDPRELTPQPQIHPFTQNKENLEIIIPKNLDEPALANFLIHQLKAEQGLSAIIFNSKKQLQYLTLQLSASELPILSQLTGSFGKLQEQFDQHMIDLDENGETKPLTLLITPQTWEKLENHDAFNTVFIHKLPFEPPSDPLLMALSNNYQDPFNDLQVPRAINSLIRIVNRLKKDQTHNKKAFILDNRILYKGYGQKFVDALDHLGLIQVKNFSIDFFKKPL